MANLNSNSTTPSKDKTDSKTYKTSQDVEVPKRIIDQIIGQEEAVETVKKQQNREEMFC